MRWLNHGGSPRKQRKMLVLIRMVWYNYKNKINMDKYPSTKSFLLEAFEVMAWELLKSCNATLAVPTLFCLLI